MSVQIVDALDRTNQRTESATVQVITVETPELGDRSYLAHDGEVAVVVDPQRDFDRLLAEVERAGVRVTHVLETHLHNDYVSGGRQLAAETGASYLLAADDDVTFPREPIADGEQFHTGTLTVRAVTTPGHTDHHLSYVVSDGSQTAAFTGGSLLYGTVGRTDLVDPARTEELTRAQYRSARRLAELLPDDAAVFPTHGFGSFCSSGNASGAASSTLGQERAGNDALVESDEDAFVARLVAGLTPYPRYYAHMGPRNREGGGPVDLSPPQPVDAGELGRRIDAGEWVVDLRARTAYARGHVAGTIGFELGQQFATYLGWLIPWTTPLTLIGDHPDQVAEAQRQLVRIGIDRPAGAAVGKPEALTDGRPVHSYRVADLSALQAARADGEPLIVLDVRGDDERQVGHLPDSLHTPLYDLPDRLDELPSGTLWVHCASGYRSSIAASLLDRAGRDVVLIDDTYPPPDGG